MNEAGKRGEDLAVAEYQNLGYKVIERNFVPSHGKQVGEIDLVCLKDNELVFVEVKLRQSDKFGNAFEAVDYYKQKKLVKTVKLYLQSHSQFLDYNYRIDVAAVTIDNREKPVTILVNAIEDFD